MFKDAIDILDKLSADKMLNPRGVVGLVPANRVGDDNEIDRDETRTHVIKVSHHQRQQTEKTGFANYCLADFVAPKVSGKADYIGSFAVTGGLEEASDKDFAFDCHAFTPPLAHRLCVQEVEASIETLRNYIDWTPFFMTWTLAGKYPRILEDEVVGVEAQRLFKVAIYLLDKLSAENTLNPRGVVGLVPANRVGDDIVIYRDDPRPHVINVSHHLRQQT